MVAEDMSLEKTCSLHNADDCNSCDCSCLDLPVSRAKSQVLAQVPIAIKATARDLYIPQLQSQVFPFSILFFSLPLHFPLYSVDVHEFLKLENVYNRLISSLVRPVFHSFI